MGFKKKMFNIISKIETSLKVMHIRQQLKINVIEGQALTRSI